MLACARPASAQWVVAGYLGTASTSQTSLALAQSSASTDVRLDDVNYEGRSFSLPLYYGYRVAYFPGTDGWLGIEAEVIHMKVYARTGDLVHASGKVGGVAVNGSMPLGNLIQRFSLSHGQNMILFNAVLRHVFGECGNARTARLIGAARIGLGPTLPHVESTVAGVGDERYQWGALGVQAAAGIELLVWKQLHALAEYKFTRCRQSVTIAGGGTAETLLASHHVVFGASWHF